MAEEQSSIPVLFTEKQIKERIREMGAQITRDFRDKNHIRVIGALKGCFLFMSDLIREVQMPVKVDFMEISSYGNAMESSGNIKIIKDLTHDIENEHVIIAEDIIDTGLTLNHVMDMLSTRKPASLSIATLLLKPQKSRLQHKIAYCGFEIKDHFVVGYGLDYKGYMRNLPYIGRVTNDDQLDLFS